MATCSVIRCQESATRTHPVPYYDNVHELPVCGNHGAQLNAGADSHYDPEQNILAMGPDRGGTGDLIIDSVGITKRLDSSGVGGQTVVAVRLEGTRRGTGVRSEVEFVLPDENSVKQLAERLLDFTKIWWPGQALAGERGGSACTRSSPTAGPALDGPQARSRSATPRFDRWCKPWQAASSRLRDRATGGAGKCRPSTTPSSAITSVWRVR